jgi:hypothetical protein
MRFAPISDVVNRSDRTMRMEPARACVVAVFISVPFSAALWLMMLL